MKALSGLLAAVLTAALASPALAADFRQFSRDDQAVAVIDIETITPTAEGRNAEMVVIFRAPGDGVWVGLMPVEISCKTRAFRSSGAIRGFDRKLVQVSTEDSNPEWTPIADTPVSGLEAYLCDGQDLTKIEGATLQEVVDKELAGQP
jgi:hypothetical protein